MTNTIIGYVEISEDYWEYTWPNMEEIDIIYLFPEDE